LHPEHRPLSNNFVLGYPIFQFRRRIILSLHSQKRDVFPHVLTKLGRTFDTNDDYQLANGWETGKLHRMVTNHGGLTMNIELVLLTVTQSSPSTTLREVMLSALQLEDSAEARVSAGFAERRLSISRLWALDEIEMRDRPNRQKGCAGFFSFRCSLG
jgi:hypothetical protein